MPLDLRANGYWQRAPLETGRDDDPPLYGPRYYDFVAIDTETTGINPHRPSAVRTSAAGDGRVAPCQPFAVAACGVKYVSGRPDERKLEHCFVQADVDPHTREVAWSPAALRTLADFLNHYSVLVFHNALFDLGMLAHLPWQPHAAHAIHDTLAASHVLDSHESHGLKDLCVRYLDMHDADEDVLRGEAKRAHARARELGWTVGPDYAADYWLLRALDPDSRVLETYNRRDAHRCALLWMQQRRALCRDEQLYRNYLREQRVLLGTRRMMSHPVHLRRDIFRDRERYARVAATEADAARQAVDSIPGWIASGEINLRSAPQIRRVLYDHFGFPVTIRTKTGEPSTNKFALQDCALHADQHSSRRARAGGEFLEHFGLCRQHTSAVDSLDGYLSRAFTDGRRVWLYSVFKPWATHTTRFASEDPNLQNVRRDDAQTEISLRGVFGPPPGRVWYAYDYNQLEIRLMAHASGDPTLRRVLSEGADQHQITIDAINLVRARYKLPPLGRRWGKIINFAWQYGAKSRTRSGKPGKLALIAGIPADDFDESMRRSYPEVVRFMADTSALVRRQGYVTTLFGYRLYIPERFNEWTGEMELPEYVGVNYIIQGSAGDICKNSMIAVDEYLDATGWSDRAYLLLTIHDELIIEAPRGFPRRHVRAIRDICASAGDPIGCETPVKCSRIATRWSEPATLEDL